ISANWSSVRRWAARPADSVSRLMRSSSTASTSTAVSISAGSMRKPLAARGLQLRQGLAHDGAAHAPLAHDLGLGRQLVTGLERSFTDARADALDELMRQIAQALARPRVGGPEFGIALSLRD